MTLHGLDLAITHRAGAVGDDQAARSARDLDIAPVLGYRPRGDGPGQEHRILGGVQRVGLAAGEGRTVVVPGGLQHPAQRQTRVGVIEHQVGVGSDGHRVASHRRRVTVSALRREDLGPHRSPRDRGFEVVSGYPFAFSGVLVRLLQPPLRQNRSGQQGCGLAGVGSDTEGIQALQRDPKVWFGGHRVAHHQLDEPGEQLGFHQPVPQAQIGDDLPCVGQHRTCLVRASAEQLEYRQTPQGGGFQRWRCGGHPLHPNHIQAPAARLRRRTGAP